MAHGCMSQSIPIVTAYDTLGEAGVDYTIQSTKPKAIYTDPHLLRTVMKSVENTKEIKVVIYNNDGQTELKQEDIDVLKAASDQLVIVSFEELRQLGADNPIEPVAPAASDLACIMFTSGSTGPPKGVPLLHSAVVAAGKILAESLKSHILTDIAKYPGHTRSWEISLTTGSGC
jgi:long-chain acyl-CoA synthetase